MDLETENRIAAILMKEAAELRRQAEKEGVHVYLQQPKPRVRPNPRFLAATVLGVQQANRVVEVNEMWRIRGKEKELDDRLNRKSSDQRSRSESYREGTSARESASESYPRADDNISTNILRSSSRGDGLRDEELEAFLHSRAKRGRGSVGSRMDKTVPYTLPSSESNEDSRTAISEISGRRVVHGPEKPSSLKPCESLEEESEEEDDDDDDDDDDDRRAKKRKRSYSRSSKKQHFEKHRSKSRSKDKKKRKKEERRSKHKR